MGARHKDRNRVPRLLRPALTTIIYPIYYQNFVARCDHVRNYSTYFKTSTVYTIKNIFI
jgi:hypothetical protein